MQIVIEATWDFIDNRIIGFKHVCWQSSSQQKVTIDLRLYRRSPHGFPTVTIPHSYCSYIHVTSLLCMWLQLLHLKLAEVSIWAIPNLAPNFQMAFLTPLYIPFPAQNCPNICYLYSNNVLLAWYISTHINMKLLSLEKKDNLYNAFFSNFALIFKP